MDTIVVRCGCGQSMRARREQRGTRGRCPRCAATIHVPDESSGCAQCQRPFRGTWDQHKRPHGTICHICANQYVASPEEESPDPVFDISEELRSQRATQVPQAATPRNTKPPPIWWRFCATIGAMLAAVGILFAIPDFAIDPDFFTKIDAGTEPDAQLLVRAMALHALLAITLWMLMLFVVLRSADALPSYRMRDNLLILLAVGTVFHLADVFAGFNLYLVFVVVVLQLKILDWLFDLEIRDMLFLVLVYGICSPVYLLADTAILNLLLRYGIS